jgi:ribonuclease HI
MKKITLFTDGACSGNPGPGGWGAILQYEKAAKEISGGLAQTTNNRMELRAVIEGLSSLKESCEVEVVTDSRYVADGINKGWAKSWRARGWIKADKKKAQNIDLWEKLLALCETHKVRFTWVRGHNEHPQNERCDELAVAASQMPGLPVDRR